MRQTSECEQQMWEWSATVLAIVSVTIGILIKYHKRALEVSAIPKSCIWTKILNTFQKGFDKEKVLSHVSRYNLNK
jgi:uncharacterized membrane protein